MPTYISFLRAVNVGKRKVLMADLRAWLVEAGYRDVETHIQTGNVRVTTGTRSTTKVAAALEELMAERAGFDVPNIVLTPAELTEVFATAQSLEAPLPGEVRRYVTFLRDPAPADAAAELDAWDVDGERVRVVGRAVHWWLAKPTQDARLSNARLEKALGPGTTRDLKVVSALAGKWGA